MAKPKLPPDPVDELVRKNIRLMRDGLGYSTEAAAMMAGVSVDNLRRYESGKIEKVPSHVLRALAEIYGCQMEDFYLLDPPKPDPNAAPVAFLRTRPGIRYTPETHAKVMAIVEEASKKITEEIRRAKKK